MVKKLFLFVLVGIAVIFLLQRGSRRRLVGIVPASTLGKSPDELFEIVREIQSDPMLKGYLEFARAHPFQIPTIEEKDGRLFACYGNDTFDITDLGDNPLVQGLRGELKFSPQA